MARRRSCSSCGQEQTGSNAFCASCGKPLDAPDLELLSAGSTNQAEGVDIDMARSFSRGRALGLLGGVVALLAGVAAFSGNGTKSSTASSTTSSTAAQIRRSTTTTTAGEPVTTLRNALTTDGDSNATAVATTTSTTAMPPGPYTLPSPPLPGEKTGAKLLLFGLQLNGQTKDSILDVDSGVVNRLSSAAGDNGGENSVMQIAQTAHGLVSQNATGTMTSWHVDGATVDLRVSGGAGGPQPFVVVGDTLWRTVYDQPVSGGNPTPTIYSLDMSSGTSRKVAVLPEYVDMVGTDGVGHAVVRAYVMGGFVIKDTDGTFQRLTPNFVLAASAGYRVELTCDDSLVCMSSLTFPDGTTKALNESGPFGSQYSISPDGRHVLVGKNQSNGNTIAVDVIETATLKRTHLGDVSQSNYFGYGASWGSAGWTSDGTWLFLLLNDHVVAWRDGLAEPITLKTGDVPLRVAAVGVFPA